MKRRFLPLLALLLATTLAVNANPVSQRQARKVGAKYLTHSLEVRAASEQDLKLAATYRTEDGTAAFYIFNGPSSFVIVSADDCATPILGSSATNQFNVDDHAPALEEYLQGFVEQIDYGIKSGLPALDTVAHQWELVRASGLLRDDRATAAYMSPLLTSTWGQGSNGIMYNMYCPTDPNGPNGHAITGCQATAMGQVLRYWNYPIHGTGSYSYTPPRYPNQPQYVNFGNTTYDWANMPDELTTSSTDAQNAAVATLLWHCGVANNMDYGPDESSATTDDAPPAFLDYFKYSEDLHLDYKSDFTDNQWLNKVKTDLNAGRPLWYRGSGSGGHAFVCDGYNADDALHFNWGWNGNNNDYYVLGALTPGTHNYSYNNAAIFEIHPGECEDASTRSLPYFDGFEAGSTQWWCWDKADYTNSANDYESSWSIYAYSSGGKYARRLHDASRNVNDWAVTPPMFLQPGRDNTQLTFKTYETITENYTFEGVYISTSGLYPNNFTQIWTQNNPSASWKEVTINLNAYQGQTVYIAFVYTGKDGHNWFIDNVSVTEDWQPCGTTSLPFEENFTSNINSCWYIIDGDMSGGGKCWQWKDASRTCAYHPYGQSGKPQEGWLISKRMFLQPQRDATTLTFYSASTSSGTGRKNSIWLAIDKPLGELTPSDFTVKVWEDPDYSSTWTQYTVNLSAYQGHNINIGFKYEGTYAHNWFVDGVVVNENWAPCSYATAPCSEGFNSSLSSCWYVIDNDKTGDARCWKYNDTDHCVYHPWGQQGVSQEGWLFSKMVWLPSSNVYKLSFKSKNYSGGTGRRNSVWIAVDKTGTPNPSDYTEIWVDPSYNTSWTNYEVDLSAYSGHYVNIAFKYEGTYAHNWYVDDFSISQIPTYTITASASPSAGGSVTGAGTYNEGATCILTASSNTGYHFVNWTKNGTQVSTNPTYSFTVTGNATYVANFELDSYSITASANPSNGGTVSGAGTYNYGASCTLTAMANSGYVFSSWKKNGNVVSNNPTYTFTVTNDGSYVAYFQTVPTGSQLTVYPNAESTDNHIPMYVYYFDDFTRAQHVIPASELTAMSGGQIKAIKYYTNSEGIPYSTVSEIDFYLKEVESPTLTGYVDKSTAQIVYHGVVQFVTAGNGGEVTVCFTTPFNYNGGNLLVGCDNTTDMGYKNIKFIGETGHTNAALYGSDGSSLGNVSASTCSFLPKSTFTYTGGGGGSFTQTSDFVNGWTWWSSGVETSADVLNQLKTGLGDHGKVIKSQTQSTMHMGSNWVGSLTMNNENGYMVKADASLSVDITGPGANPLDHPITLTPGWTWIGYPCAGTMTVSDALANFTPQASDVIKGQNASSMYMAGSWRGALTLTPGIGLMYKSNSNSNKTLTYATPSKMTEAEAKPIETHWDANYSAYPTNMTVLAVVELDGEELNSEQYELAAFANGECRGSVAMMYVEPLDRYMALLTISGEEADNLHFGLYNSETGEECFATDETLTYETDAIIGSPDEPFIIRFRNTTGVDEWSKSLQVFPNPVEHGQTISLGKTDDMGEIQVEIINPLGNVVKTVHVLSSKTITVPNVAGVYTLRITVEGKGTCYRKLIVR